MGTPRREVWRDILRGGDLLIVSVRSEMDSRPLIYALMRVLKDYGSVCLISDNKRVQRLIDSEEDGACRNIRIIYDESGASDSVFEEYGIVASDYDFLILDNMSAVDYDVLIVPLGEIVTDSFQYDIDELKKDANTRFIQFGKRGKGAGGKGAPKKERPAKTERPDRPPRGKKGAQAENVNVQPEDYDPAAKFRSEISIDEEYNVSERFYDCDFPSYQEIEDMEAKHMFMKVGPKLGEAIYDIFKDKLGIEKRMFLKAVAAPDKEIRGHVHSTKADLESNPKKNPRERGGRK